MSTRFYRNSLFSSLAALATALGSLLSMVIIARLLGTTGTGQVAYALWIVTFAVTFADLGIYQTLTRYLPEMTAADDEEQASHLSAYLVRYGLFFGALTAAALVVRATTATEEGMLAPQTWGLISLFVALQILSSLGLGVLRGLQQFDRVARFTVAALVLQLVSVFVGASWAGADGALVGYCAGHLLPVAVTLGAARGKAAVDSELRRRMIKFSLFSWAGSLTTLFVWSRLEVFFLQRYFGLEAVALFTAGLTIANLASQGPLLLTGALLAHFSESYGLRQRERMQDTYATATSLIAFLVFPGCFMLAAIVPVLLPLVFGPQFAAATPVACILVAGAAAGGASFVGAQMMLAHERSDFIFASSLVGAVLSLAAGILVIPVYGLMGAAIARALIHLTLVASGLWFLMRHLQLQPPFLVLGKLLLSAMIAAAATFMVMISIEHPILALPAALATGGVAYLASVRALGALSTRDVQRLLAFTVGLPRFARAPAAGLITLLAAHDA